MILFFKLYLTYKFGKLFFSKWFVLGTLLDRLPIDLWSFFKFNRMNHFF